MGNFLSRKSTKQVAISKSQARSFGLFSKLLVQPNRNVILRNGRFKEEKASKLDEQMPQFSLSQQLSASLTHWTCQVVWFIKSHNKLYLQNRRRRKCCSHIRRHERQNCIFKLLREQLLRVVLYKPSWYVQFWQENDASELFSEETLSKVLVTSNKGQFAKWTVS
ncbi:hypothetical protein P5673_021135, partial [Acropora cervicornis]